MPDLRPSRLVYFREMTARLARSRQEIGSTGLTRMSRKDHPCSVGNVLPELSALVFLDAAMGIGALFAKSNRFRTEALDKLPRDGESICVLSHARRFATRGAWRIDLDQPPDLDRAQPKLLAARPDQRSSSCDQPRAPASAKIRNANPAFDKAKA